MKVFLLIFLKVSFISTALASADGILEKLRNPLIFEFSRPCCNFELDTFFTPKLLNPTDIGKHFLGKVNLPNPQRHTQKRFYL